MAIGFFIGFSGPIVNIAGSGSLRSSARARNLAKRDLVGGKIHGPPTHVMSVSIVSLSKASVHQLYS